MAWLLNILKPFFGWVFQLLITNVIEYFKNLYLMKKKEQEIKEIEKINIQKQKEAIEKGNLDDIAKTSEDILNGRDSSKP